MKGAGEWAGPEEPGGVHSEEEGQEGEEEAPSPHAPGLQKAKRPL